MEQDEKVNIWPGPKPYDEKDHARFKGRQDAITYITDRVKNFKFSVLTGESGTGKTSLLRAGVVADLRKSRYSETQYPWIVLLLRDWAVKTGSGVWDLCHEKILNSFHAIHQWEKVGNAPSASREAEILDHAFREYTSTRDKSVITDHLKEILEWFSQIGYVLQQHSLEKPDEFIPFRGFILIFDQFEELIRSEKKLTSQMIELIQRIIESRLPIHILLSLRKEYISDLRVLDQAVNGLMHKTYTLEPMTLNTAMAVIRSVTQENSEMQVTMEESCIKTIQNWLVFSDDNDLHLPEDDKVELIKLQAVLRELFDHVLSDRMGRMEDKLVIRARDLDSFKKSLGANEVVSGKWVVQNALQRWVSKSVMRPLANINPNQDLHELYQDFKGYESRLDALVKRIAVRIAPHLSSSDFKISQEHSALFRKALGDDILVMIGGTPMDKEKIAMVTGNTLHATLNYESIITKEGAPVDWKNRLTQSGLAKEKGWDALKTANSLVLAFQDTLERMKQNNILKHSGGNWELVHDQMGQSLTRWADEHRHTWEDCVASTTLVSGVTPLVIKEKIEKRVHAHLRWYGCDIRPFALGGITFKQVEFNDCFFNGAIFTDCIFAGCTFRDCTLHGVIFRDCHFIMDDDIPTLFQVKDLPYPNNAMSYMDCTFQGVVFSGGEYNQMVIASLRTARGQSNTNKLDNLTFENCKLTQFAISDVGILHPLRFTKSTITQGYFTRCQSEQNTKKTFGILLDHESKAIFCSGDEESWDMIQPARQSSLVSCGVIKQ